MNKFVEKIIVNTLTAREYLLSFLLFKDKYDFIQVYINNIEPFTMEDFKTLERMGFIKFKSPNPDEIFFENIIKTEKLRELFKEYEVEEPRGSPTIGIGTWIDDWYNLFPSKVRSGGYPVRCDKRGCFKKMIKFCKDNPDYNKDIIFEATKFYITSAKNKDYQYMKLAPYFIEKDGISMLAGECENIINRMKNNEKTYETEQITNIEGI